MRLLHALRMSPFDIAVFIVPISLTIAHLRGPSGMVSTEAADLAIASLVQAIVAADVGLIASTTVIIGTAAPSSRTIAKASRRHNFASCSSPPFDQHERLPTEKSPPA
jgi:hypothetical protein